jgi:3-methyladenine DNA glycosylase AlkD
MADSPSFFAVEDVLQELMKMANPAYLQKMEYFGIPSQQALGIRNTELKIVAKRIGKNQPLANQLWEQQYHECKLLAIHIGSAKHFTEGMAEKWTQQAYSWDLVDGVALKLLPKQTYTHNKILEWSTRETEFEKRMAFAAIVGVTIHNKSITDEYLMDFFSLLEREAWDDRNFVKKALNWALRQIGKKNEYLNGEAIRCAERIWAQNTRSSRWIARDALRELTSTAVQERLIRKGGQLPSHTE